MLFFGVQVQNWVYQHNSPADATIPILAPDFVQRPVDVGPALGFLLLWEQGHLLHLFCWDKATGFYGKAAYRNSAGVMPFEYFYSSIPDIQRRSEERRVGKECRL